MVLVLSKMRLRATLLALAPFLALVPHAQADPTGGALYPPGLQPLINRANALFSIGQFSDAAKAYTDAIGEPVFDNQQPVANL